MLNNIPHKTLLCFLATLFCLSLPLIFGTPAHATSLLTGTQESTQEGSVTVSEDQLNQLIETLENKEDRQEFIENLKTLSDAQEADAQETTDPQAPPALSERLGLEEKTKNFISHYQEFLADNNLNASFVGKSILSAGALFFALIFALLVRKGGVVLRNRLLRVKTRYKIQHSRFRLYARLIRYFGYAIVSILFVFTLAVIWEFTDLSLLKSDTTSFLFSNLLSILLVALISILIWETMNGAIEYAMRQSDARNSSRMKTLIPIVRNILFMVFFLFFMLMLLSELGINIMPLLAGAGIFGIAIGFGAQTMVKDFITGFTIILEDLIQVGDVVTLGGYTGIIEKITIRKVQLRDLDGTVYTVPFSSISIVENLTKEFSYYLMDIGVAYREDTDEVIGHIKDVDEDMRNDEHFGKFILDPIEILGLDKFADSAIIIKARIKTRPIKQWEVGREFNRRLKYKFDEHDIEIPFPHQTLYFGTDKDGSAPPAPVLLKKEKADDTSENTQNDETEKTDTPKAKRPETTDTRDVTTDEES